VNEEFDLQQVSSALTKTGVLLQTLSIILETAVRYRFFIVQELPLKTGS